MESICSDNGFCNVMNKVIELINYTEHGRASMLKKGKVHIVGHKKV